MNSTLGIACGLGSWHTVVLGTGIAVVLLAGLTWLKDWFRGEEPSDHGHQGDGQDERELHLMDAEVHLIERRLGSRTADFQVFALSAQPVNDHYLGVR